MFKKGLEGSEMLQFDIPSLTRDILKECEKALKIVAEKAKQAMIYELSSHAGAGYGTTGRSQWNREVGAAIDFIAANIATEAIVKVGLVNSQNDFQTMYLAQMLNYGTGTKMSDKNPFLEVYLNSDLYNPDRRNRVITERKLGERIYDPEIGDWRTIDPDRNYDPKNPTEYPQFSQPPTYFFENGLRLIVADFNKAIDDVTSNFNFSKYLKSTVK
jgi:hypothetical protein